VAPTYGAEEKTVMQRHINASWLATIALVTIAQACADVEAGELEGELDGVEQASIQPTDPGPDDRMARDTINPDPNEPGGSIVGTSPENEDNAILPGDPPPDGLVQPGHCQEEKSIQPDDPGPAGRMARDTIDPGPGDPGNLRADTLDPEPGPPGDIVETGDPQEGVAAPDENEATSITPEDPPGG
jgi:hypothetical protein